MVNKMPLSSPLAEAALIDSLLAPGYFAHRANPDWQTMQPLSDCTLPV